MLKARQSRSKLVVQCEWILLVKCHRLKRHGSKRPRKVSGNLSRIGGHQAPPVLWSMKTPASVSMRPEDRKPRSNWPWLFPLITSVGTSAPHVGRSRVEALTGIEWEVIFVDDHLPRDGDSRRSARGGANKSERSGA